MTTATLVTALIGLLCLGAVVASMTLIPTLSRPTVPLGVSIPADRVDDPAVRGAVRRYRIACVVLGLVAAAGMVATVAHPASLVAWPLGYLLAACVAFVLCRRPLVDAKRAGDWYAGHRVALSAPVTTDAARGVGPAWWLHLVALLLSLASAAWAAASYDRLPDPLPAHWGPGGVVDRWEPKTWASVLSTPGVAVLIVAGVAACCVWMGRRVDPLRPDGDPERARRAQARKQRVMQVSLGWINVTTALLFALLTANLVLGLTPGVFNGLMIGGVGIVFVPIVWMLIAGSRVEGDSAIASGGPDSPDDDAHWPGGLFYFNREDPRLNVPKRAGLGYTINVAHPAGLALSALLVLVLIASAVLPFALTR